MQSGVNTVRIRTVHLVGASGEDSVGRRNLAHVFERRKAIVDTAIVRLLKKEKSMTTDAIALQASMMWLVRGVPKIFCKYRRKLL